MRKTTFIVILFLLLIVFFSSIPVLASPAQDTVEKQLNSLDKEEIDEYWNNLMNKYGGFFPENQKNLYDLVIPGKEFEIQSFFSGLIKYFFYEILL